MFDYYLSDSPACRNRGLLSLFFFKCPAYSTIREVLFENIFNLHVNESITLDLLMFGNPDLDNMTNEAIFEYVHEYIKLSKRFNELEFICFSESLANHTVNIHVFSNTF